MESNRRTQSKRRSFGVLVNGHRTLSAWPVWLIYVYSYLAEIGVHKFHYEVYVLEFLQRPLRRERVKQSYNILVVDELHELELTVGSLRMRHILERTAQLLYCDILLCHCVVSGTGNNQTQLIYLKINGQWYTRFSHREKSGTRAKPRLPRRRKIPTPFSFL